MTNSNELTVSQQQKTLGFATRSKNPVAEAFPDYCKYTHDDFEASLYYKIKSDLDAKTIKWALRLTEANVGPYYKACKIGWTPKTKQQELNKNWARYLVAMDSNKTPIAFSMFRFDMDYGSCVLYCYEMQVEKSEQRKGLGKFMMSALEKCAQHFGLEKLVLTVLKNNTHAMEFFKSLGYSVDDTSPDSYEEADYDILSKKFV